ncbi:hypothetical protein Q31b_39190 [Novipirellula aureliae]|uniref:Sulfatase n=2 Tax=Novipirellula aureliae TaxID=2527966 RepID=A0A5C6DTL0_9BACT|nr:hypothetical protein Q31b_39190 [Novipirellula aureliae]
MQGLCTGRTLLIIFGLVSALVTGAAAAPEKLNVVLIDADDMGYGEIRTLNPERGKIPASHLDSLVADGMTITGANASYFDLEPKRPDIKQVNQSQKKVLR